MSARSDRDRDRTDANSRRPTPDTAPTYGERTAGIPAEPRNSLREDVVAREKNRFGGIKVGSAFFGWIAAMGIAILLTALVAATGAAVGLGTSGNVDKAISDATKNPGTAGAVGIGGAIALIVIVFIAYYCGGYVASRMARFNGVIQGLFVWLWAVVIAIIIAIVAAVAGSQFNVLGSVNAFPRIPVDEGTLTTAGIVTAIVIAIVSLIGALLGGMAGMHFHRKVDRAGLGR